MTTCGGCKAGHSLGGPGAGRCRSAIEWPGRAGVQEGGRESFFAQRTSNFLAIIAWRKTTPDPLGTDTDLLRVKAPCSTFLQSEVAWPGENSSWSTCPPFP